MSPTMTLRGELHFGMLKYFVGGEMTHAVYTGPGELLLAPATLGDIALIRCDGDEVWHVGKTTFLACTQGISKQLKRQESLSKMLFSKEGVFIYHFSGSGLIWITSFGAIIRKDVSTVASLH